MSKKLTKTEVVKRSIGIHGFKYGYDKSIYVNGSTKMEILCNACDEYFWQRPFCHMQGKGCKKCAIKLINKKNTKSKENFLSKIDKRNFNLFDYSEINYINRKTPIKIKCKNCNTFFMQKPSKHLFGRGCKNCSLNKHPNIKLNKKQFVDRSNEKHATGNFDYSSAKYVDAKTKVEIKCNNCLFVFWQAPHHHMSGIGCPSCKTSSTENKLSKILSSKKLNFVRQKTFPKCKYKKVLQFDFYLPEFNLCIEYNGRQHYEPVNFFGGEEALKENKKRDKIKKDFCKKEGIKFLEIPHWEKKNIKDILIKKLISLGWHESYISKSPTQLPINFPKKNKAS